VAVQRHGAEREGPRDGPRSDRVVEEVGADVEQIETGDLVLMPFAYSDGTCAVCRDGLQTACVHGGFFGNEDVPGVVTLDGVPGYRAMNEREALKVMVTP
jgi:threonine dehydrogenase-like Zn-dependent dehydrogenase